MPLTPTLYLSRTGILEPLGQSQVLAYLCGLSKEYAVTLISFERAADLEDTEQLARIEAQCAQHGIKWVRLRYRRRPKILAAAFNLMLLVFNAWREARASKARLIHARSYIPAAAAWAVSRTTGIPYIFDMRSLWAEELITSRRMRRGSLLHKLIFKAEGRLLRDAAKVVSLTHVAASYLEQAHPGCLSPDRLCVIPTCTDLNRFRPLPNGRTGSIVVGCHGSLLNGWFRIDLLAAMFDLLAQRLPDVRFEILTRDDPAQIRAALAAALQTKSQAMPDWYTSLTIEPARASEIHTRLQMQDLSVFFYASGETSELGRSPTRMGEVLGCGVPVVTNRGIGDVATTLQHGDVGVILEGEDAASLARAADQAVTLMRDPVVTARCREVAQQTYSLDSGIQSYLHAYHDIVKQQAH